MVVEWNPLPGAPRLADELRASVLPLAPGAACPPPPVRVITVPPSFHARVEKGTGQSFFEFLAKNVPRTRTTGRRATSPGGVPAATRTRADAVPRARQVGARRARGEAVLLTNGDVVFSRAVFAFLARRALDPDAYARIPRVELGTTRRRPSPAARARPPAVARAS